MASPVSLEVTPNTTLPVGSEFRTTVKVSVEPASLTEVPLVSVMVKPAVSSSVVVTVTV